VSPAERPSAGATASEHSGRIWFVDTASLLTMAVDTAIEAEVLAKIGSGIVVIIDIVADELDARARSPQTAALAATAMARLPVAWRQLSTAQYVTLENMGFPLDRGGLLYTAREAPPGLILSSATQHRVEPAEAGRFHRSAELPADHWFLAGLIFSMSMTNVRAPTSWL
jgi:hypothetical protein